MSSSPKNLSASTVKTTPETGTSKRQLDAELDNNNIKNNSNNMAPDALDPAIAGNEIRDGLEVNNESEQNGPKFLMDWDADNNCSPRNNEEDEVPQVPSGHRSPYRQMVDTINQFRHRCGMLVNNRQVQLVIVVMISINAIMMGIGTYSFIKDDPNLNNAFETTDAIFLTIFTVELGLQFIYHGWRLLLDGWLVFDLVIIITSWSFSSVQVIRAFRIFRALRLVTRISIMKNLILALFGVVPRMAAIGLMLALIFYIFAVMFTQLFGDLSLKEPTPQYDYFGGMGKTLFTLFQVMTLDNWASICREVMLIYGWAWVPFVCFVIISGFIIVNLIIAVICDAISSLHRDDKAKLHGDYEEETDSDQSSPMEVREQLDCLEEQMEELTRIQARTFHTLQYLTRQMQMHKLKKELTTTMKGSAETTAQADATTPGTENKSTIPGQSP
eukprot:Nitzschia sp. Nitz4//scaffold89_size161592//145614//147035//NITZ4_002401-RA/size161592-processed-gene-0.25-mRNA-1//1//CDS//3329559685//4590//frame0